jgi:hypothetical protein
MKKLYTLALVLSVAVFFLGVKFVLPVLDRTVPVTVAQSVSIENNLPAEAEPTLFANRAPASPRAVLPVLPSPTATAVPTLAPIATQEPAPVEPAAPVVAAQAIARAPEVSEEQAQLDQFVGTISGQEPGIVSGVFVTGRFSLPVVQQPAGNSSFVSSDDGTATQFETAKGYGTIGLLAHNYLSGKLFFDLREGDEVIIIYGDGSQERYRINQIARYKALSPTSVYSDFVDLSDPARETLPAGEVFERIYTARDRVVFQTCTEAEGNPSWGRMFVTAEKANQ